MQSEDKFITKVASRKFNTKEKKIINPVYFNVGIYLIIPFLLGIFAGIKLDEKFNSKPFFAIIGIILGTASSLYNLWKLTKE
ncbi:hypothetical protein A3G67_04165 [Candidatus Roizmanbacteria bacterium RIFCSPLOWO2_12_FULL_40_12]|uniref:F0F1-ATPase subunit n=1 Tax=Candidatus Roizmanbacteria bacterium RIFCSPLOWO2_01_FULL_40_42 TaxID=1802066 RepID=A0A1F7J6R5_9BACT|nr:MAG: hypothetical protein A2779_00725 [Candidatus Roizmanbacteria bacterium RIFCSPHIGHO2_01_FULL_40_98]OGK29168.1 MAG: hypothetical protein A3C31_02700 [Candidatus Roizmanbacteria bacterium RIFCSPHIGHO2_02_FULL_40_53]OGK30705.1 MAG: hypothetical protein A2W49_01730 [Candidatus Roizmanbacteria bacterium RIFCSPHIGHO2_12_41_18]OGK37204.1 MAG: hypothetical protein A3E69_01910 [Candidatus Roizmanbacteria bacterium RIFCSPHIGHO2_12_FULL_40_130]OGK51278.1 MAG: hypothetical protein A3B50_04785 [Candi